MSVYFQMSGNAQVRWTAEVSEIIERFNEEGGEIEIEILEDDYRIDDVVTIQVHGMTNCTYGTTEELESIIRELNPFIVGVGQIVWDTNNGDDGVIFLGNDNPKNVISSATLEEIKDSVSYLTEKDKKSLIEYLTF